MAPRAPLAEQWRTLNRPFVDGSGTDAQSLVTGAAARAAGGLLTVMAGARPEVLVTAPHASTHERDGRVKLADRGTGGLALLLAEQTGCAAVACLPSAPGDANHDPSHPLKDWVDQLRPRPRVVIDLHGFSSRYGVEIDIGTGAGDVPPGVPAALHPLATYGWTITTDAVYDASGPNTVTSWAQDRGMLAVQLEIAAQLRVPIGRSRDLERLVDALVTAILAEGGDPR